MRRKRKGSKPEIQKSWKPIAAHEVLLKSQNLDKMADPTGFEPATSAFGGQCSIQLSYGS